MFLKGVQHMILNKMAYTAKDPSPPTAFSVPKRNKNWRWEGRGRGEGENVHLLTHATARAWVKSVLAKKLLSKGNFM